MKLTKRGAIGAVVFYIGGAALCGIAAAMQTDPTMRMVYYVSGGTSLVLGLLSLFPAFMLRREDSTGWRN